MHTCRTSGAAARHSADRGWGPCSALRPAWAMNRVEPLAGGGPLKFEVAGENITVTWTLTKQTALVRRQLFSERKSQMASMSTKKARNAACGWWLIGEVGNAPAGAEHAHR